MHQPPRSSRAIPVVLLVGLLVSTLLAGLDPAPAAAAPAAPSAPAVARPVLYLTFDDGPGHDTPAFLDLLDGYDITATFFVTGSAVSANPALAARIAADGHAIGNHSWSHPRLSSLSNGAIRSELSRTSAVVRSTTGVTPVCYRPPYGATNARVHEQAVAVGLPNAQWTTGAGSHLGLWDVDTNDWRLSTGAGWSEAAMLARLNAAGAGDTVLLHDGYSNRRRGLAVLTAWLAANHDRFEFRPLPGCGGERPLVEPALDPTHPEQWHRARIARLYLAYFGRLPDAEGFEYWNRQFTAGSSLADISYSFAVSSELARLDLGTDEDFVRHVYDRVLQREPDAAGFAYWLDQLGGETDRGELVLYFSDGVEFIRRSAPALTGACYQGEPVSAYRCWAEGLPAYDW